VVIGVLGQAFFSRTVESATGAAPVRPPFVAMRLIADGPGYAYLKEHCSTEAYLYCRVLRQDHPYSDTLLWSEDPTVSLFRGLTPEEQRVSAGQQSSFVAAVAGERPLQVLVAAAKNSVVQLLSVDLTNFNYSDGNRDRFRKTIPPELLSSLQQTQAYRDGMPTRIAEVSTAALSLFSLLFLLVFLARSRSAVSSNHVRAYCLCVLAAIAINAVICGALSGPKGRYETRLIWILPVVAGAVACSSAFGPGTAERRATCQTGCISRG
jgi:hypothetical protein